MKKHHGPPPPPLGSKPKAPPSPGRIDNDAPSMCECEKLRERVEALSVLVVAIDKDHEGMLVVAMLNTANILRIQLGVTITDEASKNELRQQLRKAEQWLAVHA